MSLITTSKLIFHLSFSVHSYVREGQVICRLVSLTDPITDLIAKYDRRVMLADDDLEIESVVSSTE